MKMPLLHNILSTGDVLSDYGATGINTKNLVRMIRNSVPFETQVASELYWLGKQNDYSLEKDFGPLRLPFPDTWMEWVVPQHVTIYGKPVELPTDCLAGAFLSEVSGPNGELGISATMVFSDVKRLYPPRCLPMSKQFQIDPVTGRHVAGTPIVNAFDKSLGATECRLVDTAIGGHLNVALLALNLINCRNVTTEIAGTVPLARSGSAKRRREPRIEFHTIVLPGMSVERGRKAKARTGTQDLMPVHRVRGHFKTFTEEAPLLGRHVGTYWWGWQVRGNKDNGVIISDYEVSA